MKKIIFLLISLGFFIPGYSFAATQDIHIEWTYDYEPADGRTLAGYYLYQEGAKICTSNTPTDRAMDCTFESEDGTFYFTLTAFCTDGYESPHSSAYSFTLSTPSEPELLAAFTNVPTSLSGDIPFTVSFDASTSTGDIALYSWNLGDNNSGSGSQVSHTYTTAGNFNATLTVTSSSGATSQKSVAINATEPQTPPSTHNIHIEWTYDYQPEEGRTLAGYYLYKEGTKICTSNTPTNRAMDCTFESVDGTFDFTLTAFCTDGFESPHSSPYTFTLTTTSEPELVAAFGTTPTSLSGDVPFTVAFDGSASTGNITSYSWNYGDNSSGSGSLTSHTYTAPGTFNAILTITSSSGATSQKSVVVNVAPAPVAAIISTPTSLAGDVPFTVSFDASSSTGNITSYTWNFGDNNSGSGNQTSHTFMSAGTFTTTLTVISANGNASQKTVTVNVSATPIAAITTAPISLTGETPFTVLFDASASTGNINNYAWNFGDNNLGSGLQTSHIYNTVGTFNATLTVTSANGTTNQKSVTVTTSAPSVPPVAIITPGTFSGDAPLTVSLDGSSSTAAVSYAWSFGDGATATGSQTNHTFTTPGSYTSTLTVTNTFGQTHSTNTTITVNEAAIENTPPTAIISSSTAMGDAPLTISFDGSASHDTEGSITSHRWNFGDGSQTTTGTTAAHNYTVAGTYNASLTVTDNLGATNTSSTPVIITDQPEENLPPTARLTTSTIEGPIALEVFFDASTSTDPEETPLTYNWNFGDGASAQGITSTHLYTSPGAFTVTLTVTDIDGATSSTSTTISAEEGTSEFQIELGEVELDHNWVRIDFSTPFINPVVVAGPPSRNDSAPCVVRLRNITSTGFDIRIQEWIYLDGNHTKETVAYLVIEQGNFTLDDGTLVEASQFTSSDTNFQTVQFNTAFTVEPVVMTSIATFNEEDTITGRLRNISTTSFEHKTQEQESLNAHGDETGNYIAWEPSNNSIGNINVIVNKTADKVRNRWYTVTYGEQLSELPIFIGTMQSQDGSDTATIRYTNKTNNEIQVMVEEEQSADDETRHTSETVGYFFFSSTNVEPLNQSPISVISATSVIGNAPLTVTFDASNSTDSDGNIVLYSWDFGDGTPTETTTSPSNIHVYSDVGSYQASLTVTDNNGGTSQPQSIVISTSGAPALLYAVNFQPSWASIPAGFTPDNGEEYVADRGYGWIISPGTIGTRDRNEVASPDQSYDTLIHVETNGEWEIAIANGTYSITICVGDPYWPNSTNVIMVEGVQVVSDTIDANNVWIEKTKTVSVNDGRLTLTFQGSTPYAQMCWLKISN